MVNKFRMGKFNIKIISIWDLPSILISFFVLWLAVK